MTPFDHIFDLAGEPVVVFEDYYCVVFQKPFGFTVEKHSTYPSLEIFLHEHLAKNFPNNKQHFVGVVHRLDVHTGGLVVMAKTPAALKHLNKQFEDKTTEKHYLACVHGLLEKHTVRMEGYLTEDKANRIASFSLIETAGSKHSVLTYQSLDHKNDFTLANVKLETGRFHQIRATFKFLGHPIVNDQKYGAKKSLDETKIWLLANELSFIHPKTGEQHYFSIHQ